ncbi:hypothetical protein [Novosphingobium sp. G106]|uniref:hypothetical protein n=1 Tax=Novosphingobium sp. G106 TaxID=2849500 RepID=UPI0020C3EA94|nr:hypothetical protein [Novosphingobium sp. G106]
MKRTFLMIAATALTIGTATTADARACKRLNKTEGAVVGAAGGAVLGAIVGGRGAPIIGAVGGGIAGHEIARTRYNQNCRTYRRTRR